MSFYMTILFYYVLSWIQLNEANIPFLTKFDLKRQTILCGKL